MKLASTATQEQVTQYLDSYISHWPRDLRWPWGTYYGIGWTTAPAASYTNPGEVARDLLSDTEFRALQLGTWLNQPDGELITAAVEAITPPPYREDIELLTEALKLAAKAQRGEGIGRAILTTVAATGLALLLATSKN